MTLGTKWKPHGSVEFKHVVEMSGRLGRMSDDSLLLGHVWNELQEAKGQIKGLEAEAEAERSHPVKCPCCEREIVKSDLLPVGDRRDARPHDSANATCPFCLVGLEAGDDWSNGARCGQDICYCNPP